MNEIDGLGRLSRARRLGALGGGSQSETTRPSARSLLKENNVGAPGRNQRART
jgi:hypothetical protein